MNHNETAAAEFFWKLKLIHEKETLLKMGTYTHAPLQQEEVQPEATLSRLCDCFQLVDMIRCCCVCMLEL